MNRQTTRHHLRTCCQVAEATAGWLYNMILSVLNNRLRRLLESKLLEVISAPAVLRIE